MSAVSDVVFTNCVDELLFLKDKNNIDIDSVEIKNDGISNLFEIEIKLSHKNDKENESSKFSIKENKMQILNGKSIQFYFNADVPNNIETFIHITIPELNVTIKTKPDIGLDQSIIDYISLLSNLDVDNYKINIDYFIMDKDIISQITPGLCCTFFIENI